MFKKSLAALLIVAVLFFALREAKDLAVEWYADNYYERSTFSPATEQPDQVCLTWSGDPATTQTIQWRTSTKTVDGLVQYRPKGAPDSATVESTAAYVKLDDPLLKNDPVIHRFTCLLSGLTPASAYTYRVGSPTTGIWSEWFEFKTAPAEPTDFSFMYMGDPQVGLFFWGGLLRRGTERFPNVAFAAIAGDLVNSGSWRNEWDEFFDASKGILDRIPIVPVLGNHDYDKKEIPKMYLESFALPVNGPENLPPERAFSFEYSNALFVALDSNLSADDQVAWLDKVLGESDAVWKFAIFHHPAYSSAPHRDNPEIRKLWGALFDKHHVDFVLQGHDHAYLRTYPINDQKRVASAKEGSYYVVSVSGSKFYEQEQHDYAEVEFANTPTYQIIDITTNPNRMTFRTYDREDKVRDEVVIEK